MKSSFYQRGAKENVEHRVGETHEFPAASDTKSASLASIESFCNSRSIEKWSSTWIDNFRRKKIKSSQRALIKNFFRM